MNDEMDEMPACASLQKAANDFFISETAILDRKDAQQLIELFGCDEANGYFSVKDSRRAVVSNDLPHVARGGMWFARTPVHHRALHSRSEV